MNRKALVVVLLSLVLAVLAGCSGRPDEVSIGVGLSVLNHQAIQLALNEISAAGGVNGVPVRAVGMEWKYRDTVRPSDVISWAERFSRTPGLVAVIGHSDSSSSLSAAAIYNQNHVPQIVTIATSPALTQVGDWTYRLCLTDAKQGPALAQYSLDKWGKKSFAIFYVNDDYGRGLARAFENEVRRLGGSVSSSLMHRNLLQSDDKDLIRSTIERLVAENPPDVYVLFQREAAAAWTLGEIRARNPQPSVLAGDSLGAVEFVKENPALTEGIRVSQFFLPDPRNPKAVDFVRKYKEFTGEEPGYGQAFAYDAVYLVADAMRRQGFTREAVKAYMDQLIREKTVIHGAGGDYRIGPDHDGRRSVYIAEARNGRYHMLDRLSVE